MQIINLHEQQANEIVQFSDLVYNWHIYTPVIINISVAPLFDSKTFLYERTSERP